MKIDELTVQKLTIIAAAVAVVALIILCVDIQIKRSILQESLELKAVIYGYSSDGGEDGSSQADGNPGVRGGDDAGDYVGYGPGFPADTAHAIGGGIRAAAGLSGAPDGAYLNGRGAGDRAAELFPPVLPEPDQG